ncbi:hypothetical protein JCM19300_4252 [Algibacter lectus]|uniref:Uncharacterized protein n=1 Tax=Algibacter lectus TaxID=221126 RepID=A0A090WVP8_9FLAO|nr:hypothetical protein JCM19300_4252 [Algibacter lectus]GAL79464.1 hypothetical protein JCM19274_1972 [Algibacter lectus]
MPSKSKKVTDNKFAKTSKAVTQKITFLDSMEKILNTSY